MAVTLVGCASAPTAAPASPAPVAKAAAPAPAAKTAAGGQAPTTLDQALAAGYEVVDKDGQRLYCRDELKTGSHLRKTRSCLTEDELRALKENAQREVRGVQIPQPTRGT